MPSLAASSSSGSPATTSTESDLIRVEVEVDVVSRQPELVEVRAHRFCGIPRVAQRRDRRAFGALRQLLAVVADDQAVVDHLRRLVAERSMQCSVQRLVRPVIRPADHVRDPEVQIVDDTREMERRRPIVAPEHHALEALGQSRLLGRADVALGARALPDRPLLPADPEPAQVVEHTCFAAGDVALRIGVVDPQQQPVAEIPVGDRAEGVSDVEGAGRARCEADPIHAADRSATLDSTV